MNHKAKLFCVVAILVFLAAPLVHPQNSRDETSPNVVINNPWPHEAIFYLKNKDGRFVPCRLLPDDWAAYKRVTHIRLWTNQVPVEKEIQNGRYDIVRNEKGLWDVLKK
jgi:hypothetical protein